MSEQRQGLANASDTPPDGLTLRVIRAGGTLCVPVGPGGNLLTEGTLVARGDALVEPAGVPAPSGGRVGRACEVELIGGRRVRAVELHGDGEHRAETEDAEREALAGASPESVSPTGLAAWASRFVSAGIGAERHGSPDLIQQLHQAIKRPVDTVICSLIDADPAVKISTLLASRFASEVVEAVVLLGRLLNAKQTLLVVDQQVAPRWWASLRRAVKGRPARVVGVTGSYPAGDPTLLMHRLLGRKLRPGRLPTECGAIVLDVTAAVAIGRLLRRGQSMLQSPVAVFDHRSGDVTYCVAPVGLRVGALMHQLGLNLENATLRAGDILRDRVISPDAVVGAGEVAVHVTHDPAPQSPGACIRCGWCVDVCPTGVHPAAVLGAAQSNDVDCARAFGLDACIECGLCTFVCPSKLPLLHGIRVLKSRGT